MKFINASETMAWVVKEVEQALAFRHVDVKDLILFVEVNAQSTQQGGGLGLVTDLNSDFLKDFLDFVGFNAV